MASDLCDYSDLPPDQCVHCKAEPEAPQRPASQAPRFRTGSSIAAKFDGRCPGCGDDIYEGDPIKRDDQDRWVHQECA